jgi:hypothetical protein
MKKTIYFLALTVLFIACNKNDDYNSDSPLPPATQTGKNIFACKVNGESFIHKGSLINCFYQYVDGGYYFGIHGKNKDQNPSSIYLGTESKTIAENEVYVLTTREDGNACGGGFFRRDEFYGDFAETNPEYTGELHITKFDEVNQIVSGTFWFDVKHPVTGERVEIREGRFDAVYGL